MAMTLADLQSYVIRESKMPSQDATAVNGIITDLNNALLIIAAKRTWPQLYKSNTLSLTANDGDISYALQSDVYEVEQMLITSPQSYSKELPYVPRELHRRRVPNKNIPGKTVPAWWYYEIPTLDTNNVETKNVSFSYRPDQTYTITYSYISDPPLFSAANTAAYPFLPQQYHIYPAYFAIWKYAERVKQPSLNPDYWQQQWLQGLQTIEDDYYGQTKNLPTIPGPDIGAM